MKKLLYKIIVLIIPFICIAFISQPFIDNALKQTNGSYNYKEWNDIFESNIHADLIIQGSSRAWVHFSPRILDSALAINTYNLGIDGYGFHMQYYRFLLYMKYNKKPPYIIQSLDYSTLDTMAGLYMYKQFIPYLDEELVRKAVIHYDGLDAKDFYVPLYKYIHNIDLFCCAIKSLRGDSFPSNGKYKGFQAQDRTWDTSFLQFKKSHPYGYATAVDTMTLRLFDDFVTYCVHNNIQLIFVNTPAYFEVNRMLTNRNAIDSIYLSYSKKYRIPYLDYSHNSICFDTSNFYNSHHLNAKGVITFNAILLKDLKKILAPIHTL